MFIRPLSILFLFLTLFFIFPSKIFANCNQTGCPADQFCYPQSGLCIDKSKAPQTVALFVDPSKCTPEGGEANSGINTAIGCISTSVKADAGGNSFFGSIIRIAVGLGGGLALLLMLYGVFIVTTSAGIPDKLKEGQEVITSAISGLLFIILSVFLLNLIGINILGIPGLN